MIPRTSIIRFGGAPQWLVAALVTVALCGGCSGDTAPQLRPVPSDDGKFTLVPSVNGEESAPPLRGRVKLTILDAQGQVVAAKETRVPAANRWQIGWAGPNRVYITSDVLGVLCWDHQEDGRWQGVRGSYKCLGEQESRHGRWIWYYDDTTVDRIKWYYLGQEVTEDEYIERLMEDQKDRP
ncbi:MAG: hypothetical protein JXL80_02590 [Planctomycetes bacterium]|nr:hypothetical protein [Planctomycetota bacterium]